MKLATLDSFLLCEAFIATAILGKWRKFDGKGKATAEGKP